MNNLLSNSSRKKVLIYFQREKDNETSNFVYIILTTEKKYALKSTTKTEIKFKNLKSPVSIKEIELVVSICPQRKLSAQMVLPMNSTKHLRKK